MALGGALEIFAQIQSLVSDKLQVVSYKWLSRNFSVSSNHAKRLLQKFVDKHVNELEVVYTLSGWLKSDPHTYRIRLASSHNLSDVKQDFEDNCSVQVYSVQACIPKDTAVLWSVEFVQAEELFHQPSTIENCLRDNRFCGVSNSYVKCVVDGKSVNAVSQLKNNMGTTVKSKTSSIPRDASVQPPQQGPVAQSSGKGGMQSSTMVTSIDKSDNAAPLAHDQASKPCVVKESTTAVQNSKKKGQNEKGSSGNGGSLANLWGRASAKSKSSSPSMDTTSDVPLPNAAFTAEAQICAHEAANAMSSDDDGPDVNFKRESNVASNRKRRVIIDFSDDDEEENVVSLASPEPPNGQPVLGPVHNTERLIMEKKNLSFDDKKEDILNAKQEKIRERDSALSSEGEIRSGSKMAIAGISLQKKTQSHIPEIDDKNEDKSENENISTSASTSPKRRKVLKTRIDERGREVTEVVWEGKAVDSNVEKKVGNSDAGSRPPVASKAQAAGSHAPTNPASKAGNKKPAKGGAKDAKQGNILSFFKKV